MPEPIRAEQMIGNFTHVDPWHEVGSTGEPAFQGNWANYTATSNFNTAAFYKDMFGVVHLKGIVYSTVGTGLNTAVFLLPSGYLPAKREIFASVGDGALARVDVIPSTGAVSIASVGAATSYLSLDGITFRVA